MGSSSNSGRVDGCPFFRGFAIVWVWVGSVDSIARFSKVRENEPNEIYL